MEKLVVMSDDGSLQEFSLLDKRLLIGRDEICEICLRDRSVSRHHATLTRVFRGFSIEDEQSTNGTKVNGTLVTKRFLKHGDMIEVGKYRLRYIAELSDQEMDMDDPDRTIVLRPVQQSGQIPPRVPVTKSPPAAVSRFRQPTPSPAVAPVSYSAPSRVVNEQSKQLSEELEQAKVRFLSGEQKGEEMVIDRSFFSIGKPGGDLVLINQRHSGYFLLKVGGDNIPKINGQSIRAGGVELKNGDRISLGELSLEFVTEPKN